MGYASMELWVLSRALVTQALPLGVSPLPIPMIGEVSIRQDWYVNEEEEDEGDMLIFLSCAFFLMCVLQ